MHFSAKCDSGRIALQWFPYKGNIAMVPGIIMVCFTSTRLFITTTYTLDFSNVALLPINRLMSIEIVLFLFSGTNRY